MSAEQLSQAQINHLSTLCFINNIDDHVKIVSGVRISTDANYDPRRVLLILEIFYNSDKIDDLSFNLHDFTYEEIIHVAQNIRSNEFILQEVDNLLAGDIE